MTREFIMLPEFDKKWKQLDLTDSDLKRLQAELLVDPRIGSVMQGTGGVRKMRFAFEHQGKSGSTRVIYIDFAFYEKIYLLTAYPKNEKDNLTKEVRNAIKQLVERLKNLCSIRKGDNVMNVFDSIMTGLQEALDYEEGKGTARTTKLSVEPLPDLSANEIKSIRCSAGLTQQTFAAALGVSAKTVEAWEAGTNRPIGPARRMISIMKTDPDFLTKYHLVSD